MDDVVSICPTRTSRGWEATLSYHGFSYDVFGTDNHTAVWKTEREALRVAADYPANLAVGMGRMPNSGKLLGEWFEPGYQARLEKLGASS